MLNICIDAGHGGVQPGAVNGKRLEKDDTLKMALKVKDALTSFGAKVTMIRTTDVDIDLMKRCATANAAKCDYYLSIHRDSSGATANGASIYVFSSASAAVIKNATAILNAVIKAGGFKSRGIYKGAPNYSDFAVNKYTNMPSALLEIGFISNSGDNKKFDKNIDNIATAIAQSIFDAFGEKIKTTTTTEKTTYSGKYPSLPLRGYFKSGDTGTQVRRLQAFLTWCGYGIAVDGDYRTETISAVKSFQKAKNITVDGLFGKTCLAKAKTTKR